MKITFTYIYFFAFSKSAICHAHSLTFFFAMFKNCGSPVAFFKQFLLFFFFHFFGSNLHCFFYQFPFCCFVFFKFSKNGDLPVAFFHLLYIFKNRNPPLNFFAFFTFLKFDKLHLFFSMFFQTNLNSKNYMFLSSLEKM